MDHVNDRKVFSRIALAFVLGATLLSAVGCKRSGPFHPYGVRHAKMHFEFLGSSRGYEDLFIDSFGVLETHFLHQDIVGKQDIKNVHVMIVKRGPTVTVVDSGMLAESTSKDSRLDSLYKLSNGPSPEEEFAAFFKEGLFHKIGDTTILGLKAQIWQQGEASAYVTEWQGIVIERRISGMGPEMYVKLVSVDTSSEVDPKVFIPPTGLPPIPPRPNQPATAGQ